MLKNLSKDIILAENLWEAASIGARMRGMLGRDFSDFDAILFRNNNSIHMFFMRMELDIIFIDKDNRIISIRKSLKPWRMAMELKAKATLELPSGILEKTSTSPGDILALDVDLKY